MSQPEILPSDTRPNIAQGSDARPVEGNTAQTLGPRLQIYRNAPVRLWKFAAVGVIGALAVFLPLIYGSWRAYQALTYYGPAALLSWSSLWFLLALLALGVLILLGILLLRAGGTYVSVHKGGVLIHRGFTRVTRLTWKQLSGISTELVEENFLGRQVKAYQHTWLYPNLGSPLRLPNTIERMPELTSQIKAALYRRLLPGLRQNLAEGQWLFFGPVGIHLLALRFKEQSFPWEKVKQLRIRDGNLEIESMDGRTLRATLAKVPNVELLLQLVQEDVRV